MDDLKHRLITDPRYTAGLERIMRTPNVLVAPTNYCNFACSYCSTGKIRNTPVNMDLALARSIIDQCVDNDWPLLFGQTYEPFLHPNMGDIVRHVLDRGRSFSSATNAVRIKPELWDLPMTLTISFSADEHDYAFRKSRLPYATYREKILAFARHRIEHNIPGSLKFQIADYEILEQGTTDYGKRISGAVPMTDKIRDLARDLGLPEDEFHHPAESWPAHIAALKGIILHRNGPTDIAVLPIRIQPNSYDAFLEFTAPEAPLGYCDSCSTMMSIQADGQVAFCCCDPSASAVAGTIDATTDIKEFWRGPQMEAVRSAFRAHKPKHEYCTNCLANVSEHIKPLLTVHAPQAVAEILGEMGVSEDLPWFRFPKK